MFAEYDEVLQDLKQFIAATVSPSEARLKDELASKEQLILGLDALQRKMMDGFAGVGEAVDSLHDEISLQKNQIDDHEEHLRSLEQTA